MTTKLTPQEKRKYNEMVELFGGKYNVNTAKIKKRILALRKRKSSRTTSKDMEDMFGY